MKKRTKIITAVLASVLAISTVSVYAYDKYVEKVNYKIVLNNREVALPTDKEIVAINDSTYLPLRALCETVLGMDVTWHGDTQTIELWNITKPENKGSHESPIPLGASVSGEFEAKGGELGKTYIQYDFAIESIERGTSAYQKVEDWYKQLNPIEYPSSTGDPTKDAEKRKSTEEKYREKVNSYMDKVVGGSDYELLVAKCHIDIKPSDVAFEYKTKANDITPYCGTVTVQGNQRQFVEYSVPSVQIPTDMKYADRTILTNGIQEGYIVLRVYKNDATPRVYYKDGQYLSLFR